MKEIVSEKNGTRPGSSSAEETARRATGQDRPQAYCPSESAGPVSWHALRAEEVSARLSTGSGGLAEAEAQRRQAAHGPNRLPARRTRGSLARFLA